ncbi:MAG: glutamine amidotransferase [Proteobacteria bacterium]|nr:glutamine amidotransferase [Pseudomonadota bacterium]MBU1595931.1 glutamine amidotransferase [Pseudomonadota bacterium]
MPQRVVYLYVLDTLADWEPGYALAELNSGRFFRKGAPRLAVKTFALGKDPVTTMGGLRVCPDLSLEEVQVRDGALMVLPGGDTWLEPRHAPVLDKAREFLAAGVPVAAICGATLALAQAGLLDDRPHTSNDLGFLKSLCPAYKGERFYRAQPAVCGGDVISASGAAPLEFATQIIKRLGVFSEEALAAWHDLHKSNDPKHFFELMQAVAPE